MIHKPGFPLGTIAPFQSKGHEIDIQDTDPSEWASWHISLRAPCHTFHKVAPLADGQGKSEQTVTALILINQCDRGYEMYRR